MTRARQEKEQILAADIDPKEKQKLMEQIDASHKRRAKSGRARVKAPERRPSIPVNLLIPGGYLAPDIFVQSDSGKMH